MYPLDLDTSGKGEPEVKALCLNLSKKNDFLYMNFELSTDMYLTWQGTNSGVATNPILQEKQPAAKED